VAFRSVVVDGQATVVEEHNAFKPTT